VSVSWFKQLWSKMNIVYTSALYLLLITVVVVVVVIVVVSVVVVVVVVVVVMYRLVAISWFKQLWSMMNIVYISASYLLLLLQTRLSRCLATLSCCRVMRLSSEAAHHRQRIK